MSNNEGILAEGFDFIEEATPFSVEPLKFTDAEKLDISESEGSSSKYKLIGKVKGCMAPIGVYSRNRRIYENNHWIKVLQNKDLQERLAGRRLFGMPSHMQKNIDDEDFREGRISHVVSVLEVRNDNNGKPYLYGEFDILDTPAGRILKAMYEGGAGIYVSTRAAGKLEPIPGDPINKRVSSDSYYLGGIDCVLNPGFLQARPAFEAVSTELVHSVLKESAPKPTLSDEERIPLSNIKADQVMNDYSFLRSMNPYDEKEQIKKAKKLHSVLNALPPEKANEEVAELKEQVEKLAKIIEKVVDDVYETEEVSETSKEKTADDYEFETVRKNALANPNLYGGRYTQKSKEEARKEYEEDKKNKITSEALDNFTKLMINSNISEEAFAEVLEILLKGND